LVERYGQVFVTGVQVLHEKCEHLFVCWAQEVVGTFAVDESEQVVPIFGPPSGGFIDIAWQQRREMDFLGAYCVHLFTHDVFHLAQDSPSKRKPGVPTWGCPADVSGTDEEAMRGNLSI
jgi:hypothetical protein